MDAAAKTKADAMDGGMESGGRNGRQSVRPRYRSKEQKRTGTAIRNSAAQASRLGMLHASVAARYQLGGMAGGALVGYGTTGSIDGALMGASFGQMGGSIAAHFAVACFTAGTPLVVDMEGNSRPIDEIEVGDFVLARSEFDPDGPLELKRVEEKFVRTSVVMELVVHGQSIKTTAEHPFFVPVQGKFVAAGELQVGEQLVGHDGKLVQIESIGSTGEVTTVYNLRVADFHTYFVGGGLWGFDVWVHNASYQTHVGTRTYCFEVDSLGRTRRAEGLLANPSDARIAKARNPAAQQRLSQGTGYHAGHLIGDQFGGPGDIPNLVLMSQALNIGQGSSWTRMERQLRELASKNRVHAVYNVHYLGDSMIPSRINVSAQIYDSSGNVTTRRWRHSQ